MKTLLDKFDAVTVNNEDLIPAVDMEFLEYQYQRFKAIFDDLKAKLLRFSEIAVAEKSTYYKPAVRHWKGKWEVEKDRIHRYSTNDNIDPWDQFRYSHYYAIAAIRNKTEELLRYYLSTSYNYFIEKYKLELDYGKLDELTEEDMVRTANTKDILEVIKTCLGGIMDFKGEAVRQMTDKIHEEFKYAHVRIKGKIVEFDRFGWGTNIGVHESKIIATNGAVSIYEKEEVLPQYMIDKTIYAGDEYVSSQAEKVETYKWFKNRKFQIKFKEPAYAKEFCNRFNFKTE